MRVRLAIAARHFIAVPTMATLLATAALLAASPAGAAAPCSTAGLMALGVPGVQILSATPVTSAPAYCNVLASVTTSGAGAPNGSALAVFQLPARWNSKFLFFGTGGLAGVPAPSANAVDIALALGKGYATAVTDTGHVGHGLTPNDFLGIVTDARWALLPDGTPDTAKVTDYFHRAVHDVTVTGKRLVRAYYDADIERAYFDGCSNGGRMAFVEATRYPDDFDGIIAGAPFLDIRVVMGGIKDAKQFLTPSTYIPFGVLPQVDQAVYASCDAADGVRDNLIQNPAKCAFDPDTLVRSGLLSPGQAESLETYFRALRDESGRLVYPGFAVSDLANGGLDAWSTGFVPPTRFTAAEPWGNLGFTPAPIGWQFVDHITKYLVERDPTFDVREFDVSPSGVVGDRALALWDRRTEAGDGDVPSAILPFIARGKKLLIYHGYSDPALPPFRTVKYYEDLARVARGYRELQENVRLFMVPDMQHCGGGPGPNVFDTLTPLENWVERGTAPDSILATHFTNNDPTQPVDRSMPLCKFPEQAEYLGGAVTAAANWACPRNHRLLEVGPNGEAAGLDGHGDDDE